jgi:glycosyltransferase involved in cell wall biosynthesis
MSSIFTIHIDVFFKLPLFREAIKAIQDQTYQNLEIIISNNGADQEITDFISETKTSDKRVKVIEYEENIYSYDDPLRYFYVLHNDALKIAEGEYIFYQSYDDLMSLDYVERMVKLFKENTECISAAGLTVSIDIKGNIAQEELYERSTNLRPRYMPGHELALDYLNPKGGKMFSAPGTIFSFRKDTLIKCGGLHREVELCHLLGLVPFGITGFDEEAIFYWRRHAGQANKEFYKRGWSGAKESYSLLNDFNIREKWGVFGEDVAYYVVSRMSSMIDEQAAQCTAICFLTLNFKGAVKSVSYSYRKLNYWKALPKLIWEYKMVLMLSLLSGFQWVIQPFINFSNSLLPSNTPGLGVVKKIQRYYDTGGVPTEVIPEMMAKKENYISNKELPRK